MKIYKTFIELARTTRCHFAQKKERGWVACRYEKDASHRFVYAIALQKITRKKRGDSETETMLPPDGSHSYGSPDYTRVR